MRKAKIRERRVQVAMARSKALRAARPPTPLTRIMEKRIYDMFIGIYSRTHTLALFRRFLIEFESKLDFSNAALLMQKSSTFEMSLRYLDIDLIAEVVEKYDGPVSARDLSMLLNGLKFDPGVHPDHLPAYLRLVKAVTPKVLACNDSFSGHQLGSALYGLKDMKSSWEGIPQLVSAVIHIIKLCREPLVPHSMSSALAGLTRLSSDQKEVLQLVEELIPLVTACEQPFKANELSMSLHGLSNLSSHQPQTLQLLTLLTAKVKACQEPFKAQDVYLAMLGIQSLTSDHKEVQMYLTHLAAKVKSCEESLNSLQISNSLFGFQNMSSDHFAVVRLLERMTPKVEACTDPFLPQYVANCLYGLRRMSSEVPEVLDLLAALVPKVEQCKSSIPFRGKHFRKAFFGLQNMFSDQDAVLWIIDALNAKFASTTHVFSELDVSETLYGLQGMSSDCEEVRRLAGLLARKVEDCVQPFSARSLSISLYGLQSMNSDHREVSWLLKALVPLVEACQETLNAEQVATALYGLQGLNSDSQEAVQLVAALNPKIVSCEEFLTAMEIGHALFGLSNFTYESTEKIMTFIAKNLINLLNDSNGLQNCSADELGWLVRGSQAVIQSDSFSRAAWIEDLKMANKEATRLLHFLPCPPTTIKSKLFYLSEIQNLVSSGNISNLSPNLNGVKLLSASFDSWLHGFAANIILEIEGHYQGKSFERINLNVQIDGMYMNRPTNQRMSKIRDDRLRKEGVSVFRWNLRQVDDKIPRWERRKLFFERLARFIEETIKSSQKS